MDKILGKLSLPRLLGGILSGHNLKDLLNDVFKQFGLTDVIGMAVEFLMPLYRREGRAAVIRKVTIKESSLRDWARRLNADGNEVVAKGRALAEAFANFVEAFIPRTARH